MREIRFRAWDTLRKEFVNPSLFRFSGNGNIHIDRERNGQFASAENELILSQLTGVKGKGGQDVYEGDIVRFNWNPILREPSSEVFEFELPVEYDDEWGCFVMRLKSKKGEEQKVAVGTPATYDDTDAVEVIGNIFENSELLK